MNIIEDNKENLIDNLLLWRDALLNFIHFNNQDFQLFIIITLIDFLIPKLSVKKIVFIFIRFSFLFNLAF